MTPSRVLICGGRAFTDSLHAFTVLDSLRPFFAADFCVCTGGAKGADALGKQWALQNMIPHIECQAQWGTYGNSAGSIRNAWMLKWFRPELVIAFPGGVGTEHMKKIARAAGVIVYEG